MGFSCFSKKSTAAKDGSSNEKAKDAGEHNKAKENAKAKPAEKPADKPVAHPIHSSEEFIEAIANRRSIYNLGHKLPHSKKDVTALIEATIRQCPSSFNVQSSRAIILYGDEHKKVWEIVKAALKKVTKEDQYAASEAKVNNCFLAGAGTVLFYEDTAAIKGQQQEFPSYADNFPVWSQHSSAIAQFAVWSALAQEKIGASLQHYNELIADELRKSFDIPEQWQLIAQMPFGSIEKPADAKTFISNEDRFIVRDD